MPGCQRAESPRVLPADLDRRASAAGSASGAKSPPANCDQGTLPLWLERDLRSDHAGETGAVQIYRGIIAFTRDEGVRSFATQHLATERRHLGLIEEALPARKRSRLVPLWRAAGFLTGALPALLGRRAVYATIDAVESFVDHHYRSQVQRLARTGEYPEILRLLEECRLDEVDHRDDARGRLGSPGGPVMRLWRRIVAAGSAGAAVLARRL